MSLHDFPTAQRLKSKKTIAALFKEGKGFVAYPMRVLWAEVKPSETGVGCTSVQVAFSVPKRRFKKATDRNLLKRRMREAYRLNRADLLDFFNEKPIALMFVFVGNELLPYGEVERGMKKALKKLKLS